jgi:hypothetical protein
MKNRIIFWIGAALFGVFVLTLTLSPFMLAGCGTVSQQAVEPQSAGYYVRPVRVADGYLVDAAFRARYNALIDVYGHKKLENGAPVFLPPLQRDDGLTATADGRWLMTTAAMENMVVLSDLKRRGAAP